MNIIKYRAYIPNLKWIVPVERIYFDLGTIEVDLTDGNGDTAEYYFGEVELMQSTGHKDKNNKEIFVSDIVKTYNGEIAIINHGEYQDEEILVLDSEYYLDLDLDERKAVGYYAEHIKNSECAGLDNRTNKWVEVIGNIYENPELLEVTV